MEAVASTSFMVDYKPNFLIRSKRAFASFSAFVNKRSASRGLIRGSCEYLVSVMMKSRNFQKKGIYYLRKNN